jgi:hypothetical protein
MNAVEIEQAISDLALQPFDATEFPYAFLAAFGNKETTLKRLRTGNNNATDLPGGVLLRNNIHIAVCEAGGVGQTLTALRASPATTKAKAKYILATDGRTLEAEELTSGETIVCDYTDFPNHFGFLLPLAGISTIKEIKDNPIDVRATGRLNKLYIELLRENPAWARDERRSDMNHFMARLVFCFFAEDTSIFSDTGMFTQTVDRMSDRSGSNTHEVLSEIFRAMNIGRSERTSADPRLPAWAAAFPYVNGGLFSGSTEVPRFTQMARTYLLHAGALNWREINPDIFGSMIQAVADDEERGALGMHYTSVPNILKVLNPLFLDDLRAALAEAGDNERKLLNLRKRMARIRVFDPACGSGNFLVIAYKQMREIEAEINRRRGEVHRGSDIPLTNFRGIELRDFPAEIARLALIIAEFQCDVLYRGQKDALAEFLPLDAQNWIVCGNALRLDWLSICPPNGTGVKLVSDDLFDTPLEQAQIDFENEGGETYICGNPPYLGSRRQTEALKRDLKSVAERYEEKWRSLDYSSAWILLASRYQEIERCTFSFVTTSSLCEGLHVSLLWRHVIADNRRILFAHRPFKWSNLAKGNAGVSVVVVGVSNSPKKTELRIFDNEELLIARNINAYLSNSPDIFVSTRPAQLSSHSLMMTGAMPRDGGNLILSPDEAVFFQRDSIGAQFVRRYVGSEELINGKVRYCIWVPDGQASTAQRLPELAERFDRVKANRLQSPLESTRDFAASPHRFVYLAGQSERMTVAIGAVSSENRAYLPVDCFPADIICSNRVYAIYNGELSDFAILSSKMHMAWAFAVCGRLEQRLSYSNTLGWNTFPVPALTAQNKADLTACAEGILLARESHFPATIADLYDPETMPDNLRHAHERNDEVLERIYIGRRFKNDTERLEKLFELYTKMTAAEKSKPAAKAAKGRKKSS